MSTSVLHERWVDPVADQFGECLPAMKITDALQKTKNAYALDLFSAATIAFVEKQLYEKGDKAYLRLPPVCELIFIQGCAP